MEISIDSIEGISMQNIPNFSNYLINQQGEVFSKTSNRYLKSCINSVGYEAMSLINDAGKRQNILIHRVLATLYIPNPENKREVNHIDANRANNTLSNLEWVTPSENVRHAFKVRKHKNSIDYTELPKIIEQLKNGTNWAQLAKHCGVDPSGLRKLIKREYERNKSLNEFNSLCDLINTYAPEKGNKGLNQKTKIIEVTFEDNTTKRFESINETARYLGCNPGMVHRKIKSNRPYKGKTIKVISDGQNSKHI